MKLSRHAFVRFWDVHAWIGVLGGLVLYVMFFAGGFALFRGELGDWQEGGAAGVAGGSAETVGVLVERALADRWQRLESVDVALPIEGARFVEVRWKVRSGDERGEMNLDTATGALAPATSQLATILYWLHFLYHPKAVWGMYVAGLLGVAMLLAIVTGVLIHLKDLATQFHQFRPRKSVRVLWSDMHKVLGVMGLPFQLMYALTGALLCLVSVAMAFFVGPVFGGDRSAATASLWGEPPSVEAAARSGPAGQRLGVDALLARARVAVPGFRPEYIQLEKIGDPAATVSFWGERAGRLFRRGDIVLRAADGALLAETVSSYPTATAATTRWVSGLHYAWFGGAAAKALYALLAAATCLTILTGNWIWLARREARAEAAGHRLLSKLTIGVGGGVLVGTAALFWANRLAPTIVRPAVEAWAFFGVWTICAVLFLGRAEARQGWVGLLVVAGGGFALVPLASVVRSGRTAFIGGVDAALMVLGAALCLTAGIVKRRATLAPSVERGPASLQTDEAKS